MDGTSSPIQIVWWDNVKMVHEHLRKITMMHQKDCNERLPTILLAKQHQPMRPQEWHPPTQCHERSMSTLQPVQGSCTNKEQAMANCVANLVDQLYDIHHYTGQYLKAASNRTVMDLANSLQGLISSNPWSRWHIKVINTGVSTTAQHQPKPTFKMFMTSTHAET
jgi:hypothetical protein